MADFNVIAVTFADPSKAYQGLSDLKNAAREGRLVLRSAAVVTRDERGGIRVPDGADTVTGEATWAGSLVGLLIGMIGGPVGMLFGWAGGLLVGGAYDARRADRSDSVLTQISNLIPNGGTALVAELEEYTPEVVDNLMSGLGGTVLRRSAASVLGEMEAAEDAYEQARKAADKAAREQKKAERKEDMEERKAALKKKLGID